MKIIDPKIGIGRVPVSIDGNFLPVIHIFADVEPILWTRKKYRSESTKIGMVWAIVYAPVYYHLQRIQFLPPSFNVLSPCSQRWSVAESIRNDYDDRSKHLTDVYPGQHHSSQRARNTAYQHHPRCWSRFQINVFRWKFDWMMERKEHEFGVDALSNLFRLRINSP
ncbi:hypothetical protein ABKN59_002953 [Abortiporus biennis]